MYGTSKGTEIKSVGCLVLYKFYQPWLEEDPDMDTPGMLARLDITGAVLGGKGKLKLTDGVDRNHGGE